MSEIKENKGEIYYYNEVGDCYKVEQAEKNGYYLLWQQEKEENKKIQQDLATANRAVEAIETIKRIINYEPICDSLYTIRKVKLRDIEKVIKDYEATK